MPPTRKRFRDATEHRPPLLCERDCGFEELFHFECGADVDADQRSLVACVCEVVRHAGRNDDHVAWSGHDPPPAQAEAHRAAHHFEALLLPRMNMEAARYAAAWGELEVNRNELAVGLGRCSTEADPLTACRVHERLSSTCHVLFPSGLKRRRFERRPGAR